MGRVSILCDSLKAITNAERAGKNEVMIRPSSNILLKFLKVMQKHGYIQEFSRIDDHRSGKILIKLTGRLNKCTGISPKYNFKLSELENWMTNLLPSRQFGVLVVTTSSGVIDHLEALKKKTGGKVIGYFY